VRVVREQREVEFGMADQGDQEILKVACNACLAPGDKFADINGDVHSVGVVFPVLHRWLFLLAGLG
jgi:hypothetical protein